MVAPTPPPDPTFQAVISSSGFGKQTADLLQYLGTDTDWTTAGFVASAGWASLDCVGRVLGPHVWLGLKANRTGATLTSTAGNIANTDLLIVPAQFRPTWTPAVWGTPVIFDFQSTLADGSASLSGTGQVTLTTASGNIATGDNVFAFLHYPLD